MFAAPCNAHHTFATITPGVFYQVTRRLNIYNISYTRTTQGTSVQVASTGQTGR